MASKPNIVLVHGAWAESFGLCELNDRLAAARFTPPDFRFWPGCGRRQHYQRELRGLRPRQPMILGIFSLCLWTARESHSLGPIAESRIDALR
jgi:hypothetical protein